VISAPCAADLVIINGRLFSSPSTGVRAEALAVVGDRIGFVGADNDIKDWVGKRTQVVNARGNTVLPGFIDSHVHFSTGGRALSDVQLRNASTPDEFVRRIAEYAQKIPKGEWLCGGRWNHELWAGSPLPRKEWIDSDTPHNPILVSRYDGHMCLANSIALKLAGITRETISPPGGSIEKDTDGEPTGILKDEAIILVQRIIPEPSTEQLTRSIKAALLEARRFGVTGIHDNAGSAEFTVYQKLYEHSELTCRIYCMMPIRNWKSLVNTGVRAPFGNNWVQIGALKGFADGSLGSSTAFFFEPYADNLQNSGLVGSQMTAEGNMLKTIVEADKAGLQVCIHAIGDKANSMVLDMYEAAFRTNGGIAEKSRFRIEHAQHLRAGDIPRFASLGVIASMQPYHLFDDGSWAEKRIGSERCRTAYAFRSLLDNGVRLAFGTDWPVVPLNPLLGIHSAMTRQTSDGKHPNGWIPEEKITLEQAVTAYSSGSAYAEFAENEKGSLTIGKLADIVVLDTNLGDASPESIKEARVLSTIVGGKVAYQVDA
jgi:predicted amidohydrolase YtcJ